jgi:virulence-associated protein VagC
MYIRVGYTLRVANESIVFQSGNSLAVRLTGDCRLPKGTRVREYRDGSRVVIEPLDTWPQGFAEALGSFPDEIPRPSPTAARSPFETKGRAARRRVASSSRR